MYFITSKFNSVETLLFKVNKTLVDSLLSITCVEIPTFFI